MKKNIPDVVPNTTTKGIMSGSETKHTEQTLQKALSTVFVVQSLQDVSSNKNSSEKGMNMKLDVPMGKSLGMLMEPHLAV